MARSISLTFTDQLPLFPLLCHALHCHNTSHGTPPTPPTPTAVSRKLKDVLRATIVGTELVQLLAIHTALVALANDDATDLKIINLKNRLYSDGADLAGYRDMNYALCFNGVTCELQIMLQVVESGQLMGISFS